MKWWDWMPRFSSVQSLSRVWLFVTPWTAARQASLSITNSWSSLKLMSIKSVMPSSHLILCRPLLLLPPIAPRIRVFSNESALHIRWPKYCSFSLSISPSNEHPGPIFRMNWLDLLAVQGTLKSLLQHHSSKTSILQCSAFFIVQLSYPYMTTGKTIDYGVSSLSLFQGIFLTQESNRCLLHYREILYQLSSQKALNSLISSSNFLVTSLMFSMYMIMSLADSETYFFPI